MIISLILAIIPGLLIVRWLSKNEYLTATGRGQRWRLFILGALTVISAVALETAGEDIFLAGMKESSYIYMYYDNFVVTAFSEELGKFLIMLPVAGGMKRAYEKITSQVPGSRDDSAKLSYSRDDFAELSYSRDSSAKLTCSRDLSAKFQGKALLLCGAVPGIFVGLGFGVTENLFYALDGDITVMVLRALYSVPGHAMYGLYMGYFLCHAVTGKHLLRNVFLAFMVPMLQHGLYDFSLSSDNTLLMVWCLIYNLLLYLQAFRMLDEHLPKRVPAIQTSFEVFSTSIS